MEDDIKRITDATCKRSESVTTECLTAVGQKLRYAFVEGVMWQLMKVRLFDNASHMGMMRWNVTRCLIKVKLNSVMRRLLIVMLSHEKVTGNQ